MSEVNVYLIGAGVIAQYHAAGAAKLPATVRLGVTDPNPAAIETFTAKFPQAKVFSSVDAMLSQPAHDSDIVIVATPPFAHHEPTVAALKTGRHVLCEKPLAMNRDQATEMLATARQHNRLLGCCSTRFLSLAAARQAKHLMDSGALGHVYHINWINRRHRMRSGIEYQPQSRWFIDITKSGGGVAMDWGPYDFAAQGELLDPIRVDVRSAWIARPITAADPADFNLETEQHVSASLLFHRRDGSTIPVTYERAACTHGHETNDVEIEADRGAVRWDWLGGGKLHHSRDVGGKVEKITTEHPDTDGLGPHDKPIVFFHRAIMGQPSPAIVNERALFNFSIIRAIYDAAATSQPQSVTL